jgi:hypothetical protein
MSPHNPLHQPMPHHNQLRIAPQPTYAKISRTHLDIETLHYYDIPYEHDIVCPPLPLLFPLPPTLY